MSYKYIDESEVPLSHRKGRWDEAFKSIPEGKALVIKDVTIPAVRHALRRRQKIGQFKNLILISREKVAYVVNPKQEV
ncbi:MAG: hypothetical protein E3J73_01115 [Candidatus Bathyarchaeum sp.]|nr:MAG: hypothetical protein E3J73_01115 [Candidatus Bathyarchaeum sp.]